MENVRRVFVSGHRGMAGSAICRALEKFDDVEIISRTRDELDLTRQESVETFFRENEIDEVYLAAARVGGIYANSIYSADFLIDNLSIEINVIRAAFESNVKKLLFLGSSCIYPKFAPQPMSEESLLSGHLEETNDAYAIAKIAGLKLVECLNRQYGDSLGIDYRSVMPTNMYGLGDNYHHENSHVIPSLIRRFHEAKVSKSRSVKVWGTGETRREFIFSDDFADACIHVMSMDKSQFSKLTKSTGYFLNVGSGVDMTIRELVEEIKKTTGFQGEIEFDGSKPSGTPRKWLNVERLFSSGWSPKISFSLGLKMAYDDFISNPLPAKR